MSAAIATPSMATYQSTAYPQPQHSKAGFYVKYDLKEVIGEGSTSKCFRCVRRSDGIDFAVKVIDRRHVETNFPGLLDQFNMEIKVLQILRHPNVIKLEDSYGR